MYKPSASTEMPPEYLEDAHKLHAAAAAWFKANPFAEVHLRLAEFERELKRQHARPEHENIAIAVGLDQVIDRIAASEDARRFLRDIDAATSRRCSYMQFKAIYDAQIQEHIKRGQMQLEGGERWNCPGCGVRCDGVSMIDGSSDKPPPGTVGVCFYCAGLQVVNATQDGWDSMSEAELRALPKAHRKQLCELRNVVRKRLADDAKRS